MFWLIFMFLVMLILGKEWDFKVGIPSVPATFDDAINGFLDENTL